MLLTPVFEAEQLTLRKTENDTAVMVPIEPWMRQQLDTVEKFVQQDIVHPATYSVRLSATLYKPLWPLSQQNQMFISASPSCNVFQLSKEIGNYDSIIIKKAQFDCGRYSVTVKIPCVNIGQHKCVEKFSLLSLETFRKCFSAIFSLSYETDLCCIAYRHQGLLRYIPYVECNHAVCCICKPAHHKQE